MEPATTHEPLLVGTTGDLYQNNPTPSLKSKTNSTTQQPSNHFKSAQWSPDGTTILTSSATNTLHSFILPADLLSPPQPHTLAPYTTHTCPEPVYASTFHPCYTLQSPPTCLILSSLRSLPIRLFSPFSPAILASYPLIKTTTEAYISPHSLLFSTDDTNHFFAGTDSCLYVFDINRNGQGPISTMRTTPSRRNHSANGQGMKGIISTMAMSNKGILAAGTFNRWVSLSDSHGRGDTISVFPLSTPDEEETTRGQGITQVLWSACSRYLCIAERCSDGISVWDIRGMGKRLAWLKGREAKTQQRLSVDILGTEVWAGGVDGRVRVWEGLGTREGVVEASWGFQAHGDAVSSAVLHPTGSVLATCSGQRHWGSDMFEEDLDDVEIGIDVECDKSSSSAGLVRGSQMSDNSLKLWALDSHEC